MSEISTLERLNAQLLEDPTKLNNPPFRAELEQAQGRLRSVHRTRPARALHVGRMLPGGPAWDALGRSVRAAGRPKTRAALDRASFQQMVDALGGVRAAARAAGCAASDAGRRPVAARNPR